MAPRTNSSGSDGVLVSIQSSNRLSRPGKSSWASRYSSLLSSSEKPFSLALNEEIWISSVKGIDMFRSARWVQGTRVTRRGWLEAEDSGRLPEDGLYKYPRARHASRTALPCSELR